MQTLRVVDVDGSVIKIDLRPQQPKYFALAHAGVQGECNNRAKVLTAHTVASSKQKLFLVFSENPF